MAREGHIPPVRVERDAALVDSVARARGAARTRAALRREILGGAKIPCNPSVARSRKVAAALGDVDRERAAGRRDGRAAPCEGAVGARVDLGAGRQAPVRLGRHREDGGSERLGRVEDRGSE